MGYQAAGIGPDDALYVLTNVAYLYVALAFFVVIFVLLRSVNNSRIGRAWRSLREDPLAAELMGMPVNWLKLLAFSFGAAVAALSGTLFAALNGGVFPTTFAFPLSMSITQTLRFVSV